MSIPKLPEEKAIWVADQFIEYYSKFKRIDEIIFELKKDNLINNLLGIKPTKGIGRGKASDLTEFSLIEREISKQRAHISYRQLMSRAGNVRTRARLTRSPGPSLLFTVLAPQIQYILYPES